MYLSTEKVQLLVTEMIECGASPTTVQKILEFAHAVQPRQSSVVTLYQDTLQRAVLEALQKFARASGDTGTGQVVGQTGACASGDKDTGQVVGQTGAGDTGTGQVVGQINDPVELILTAVSQYEAGG